MDNMTYTEQYFLDSIETKRRLAEDKHLVSVVESAADKIINVFLNDRKLMLAGNGGSAADAQHIAAEFVSRFFFDRPGLPALALTTDSSILTAVGNDYGYENLFKRQIEALGQTGDIFIGISTSGDSANVVRAVEAAKANGVYTIALCGNVGLLRNLVDLAICVPSNVTPHIQECHICIGHVLCALTEKAIFGELDN